jgi:hypothetical protein
MAPFRGLPSSHHLWWWLLTKEKCYEYPVIEQAEYIICNRNYNVFTLEDKSKYQNMGGMKGSYITTCVQYQENKNIGIELPIEINNFDADQKSDNTSYYPLSNFFSRINQNINIGILVDASNEIYDESLEFILNYLEKTIFE